MTSGETNGEDGNLNNGRITTFVALGGFMGLGVSPFGLDYLGCCVASGLALGLIFSGLLCGFWSWCVKPLDCIVQSIFKPGVVVLSIDLPLVLKCSG